MPDPIRLLLADDHPVVRQGLRAFLESREGITVVGEAADGEAVVALASELDPDVVLMDLVMPGLDGVSAIRRLRALGSRAAVIVLTSFAGDEQVFPALDAGAAGYLLKDVEPADLERAVRTVHAGGAQLDPDVAARLVRAVTRSRAEPDQLTARELEVLRLLARGRSNRQIARDLVVSEKTVKTHVSSILAKLRLADRTQAALWAVRTGLADPDPSARPPPAAG
jgi:DNA-binding NarL/FixJ family response regulator